MTNHQYKLRPESIADGWAIECSCGWRAFETFFKIPEPPKLFEDLKDRHAKHVEAEEAKHVEDDGA